MLKSVGIIPSRYNSSRFPGKPLAKIAGKALIERVYTQALSSSELQEVIVATDDQRIFDFVKSFGGQVVMTCENLETGSDRVWQASKDIDADIIVNVQGDEPLIDGAWLDQAISSLKTSYEEVELVTLGTALLSKEIDDMNCVKVITCKNSNAIYFSRFAIPYSRLSHQDSQASCFKHMGIYAYKKSFLKQYCEQPATWLEKSESLEQLRALYLGAKIKVEIVDGQSIGVDKPEDVKRVEEILRTKG